MDAATAKALLSPRVLALVLTALFPLSMTVIFLTGLWVCGTFALRVARLALQLTVWRGTNLDKYGARKGGWAVVTGASDGLGREFALQLAEKGFNVALVSRTASKLDKVAQEIAALPGEKVSIIQHPIDFAKAGEQEWARLEAALTPLDIGVLVNNAGLNHSAEWSEFIAAPPQECVDIVSVNVAAAVRMARMLLPGMVSRKRGLLLNVASLAGGTAPAPLWATYSGSKAFLITWAQAVATELAAAKSGVDVLVVMPGYVTGGMAKQVETSFHTPNAARWVRCALASIGLSGGALGMDYVSTPFWAHALMDFGLRQFGLQNTFRKSMHGYLSKERERAAKKQ
ncbi:NAD(P)-binding protein [Auricularia subglabra TFB-10046 SS5]|uniref:NAD(P)-binding protein n=1 Tax=Auricularia subglabra (strain TFB-10046 / SS5) TaxID=717982 RepID=J0LF49_AURST|nr:NAD(P)-binding protein [Auricularia subglabra TFB-10046 SS5]